MAYGCHTPSAQRRSDQYTFRHDCIVLYTNQCIDKQKFQCYTDIDGEQTAAGGTLPHSIIVSNHKPVMVDKKPKPVSIFELTVPVEHRIEVSNKLKFKKYQYFQSDITTFKPSVTPFEVGSNTGFLQHLDFAVQMSIFLTKIRKIEI